MCGKTILYKYKLFNCFCTLSSHTELAGSTQLFAKSAAMLGNSEEHTALSRAISQLAETEEKIESLHHDQANTDFYVFSELLKDYIGLIAAVRVSIWGLYSEYVHTQASRQANFWKYDARFVYVYDARVVYVYMMHVLYMYMMHVLYMYI